MSKIVNETGKFVKEAPVPEIFHGVTFESLRDVLQTSGYRAELLPIAGSTPLLRSATGGLPFEVRFENPLPGQDTLYADVMFIAGLQVTGDFPLDVVNRWNNRKRFSRLYLNKGYLLLSMDVVAAGGVTIDHLRAQIGIWDLLIQELLPYLRTALAELVAKLDAPRGPAAGDAAFDRTPTV